MKVIRARNEETSGTSFRKQEEGDALSFHREQFQQRHWVFTGFSRGRDQGPFSSLAHQAKFMDMHVDCRTRNRVYSLVLGDSEGRLSQRVSPGGFGHVHGEMLQ